MRHRQHHRQHKQQFHDTGFSLSLTKSRDDSLTHHSGPNAELVVGKKIGPKIEFVLKIITLYLILRKYKDDLVVVADEGWHVKAQRIYHRRKRDKGSVPRATWPIN